jgi:hypothetical protein
MHIYLDGLARSGNVFFSFALNSFFENQIISKRTHDISSLKKYINGTCFVVPVRDALPSLVSNVIYMDHVIENEMFGGSKKSNNYLENLVMSNKAYLEYLVKNDNFFIAPFDEIINNHITVCRVIAAKYPELKTTGKLEGSEDLIATAEKTNPYLYDPYIGNVPRNSNLDKTKIEKMLLSKYAKELDEMQVSINTLYERYYSIKKSYNL